jgi:hypothetical protein
MSDPAVPPASQPASAGQAASPAPSHPAPPPPAAANQPPTAPGQAPQPSEEEVLVDPHGPEWLDTALPWVVSGTFHLGVFLVGVFVAYAFYQSTAAKQDDLIIVPQSFEDPALAEHPGGVPNPGAGADPTRESAQDKLKEIAKSEGWAQTESLDNVAGLLSGQTGDVDAAGIFAGAGGSLGGGSGAGTGGGKMAAYGTPGGGGGFGPKSSFYGTGGNATRIVYVLDHSGSMLDNFEFLKAEAKKSVNNLVPLQFFAVVLVSDKVTTVGAPQLTRAIPEAKKVFSDQLEKERAEGQNDDLLIPFQQSFERAFAMKPQLIYFLTDGRFGDGLIKVVNNLNKDKKVHINTIAFVTEEPSYKGQLQQLATENGGVYHFIPARDLGK